MSTWGGLDRSARKIGLRWQYTSPVLDQKSYAEVPYVMWRDGKEDGGKMLLYDVQKMVQGTYHGQRMKAV